MSMNVLSQGKDSNGKVAPMGATTTASGAPAGNVVAEVTSMPLGPYVFEQGRYDYERVTTVGSDITLGATGGVGDFLHGILFPRGLLIGATGVVLLKDGGTTVAQFDATGIGGMDVGTFVELNMVSKNGVWAVRLATASTAEVVGIGRFAA